MSGIKGIDISKWQGNIDYSKVKSVKDFVIIKATEGVGYTDPKFKNNQAGFRGVGMPIGYYHYARPDLGNTAIAEADWFVKTIGKLKEGEILALDAEASGYSNWVNWSLAWLDRVKLKTGVKPLVYINLNFNNKYDWSKVVKGDYGLWLAYWDEKILTKPDTDWSFIAIKQYTSKLTVSGISGNVDGDVFYGSVETFKKYGYQENATNLPIEPPQNLTPECEREKAIIADLEKGIETRNKKIDTLKSGLELCTEEKATMKMELKVCGDKYTTLMIEKKTLANTNADLVKELNELKSKSCVKQVIDKFFEWLHGLHR